MSFAYEDIHSEIFYSAPSLQLQVFKERNDALDTIVDFAAGSVAGALSTVVGQPLDTIKVRLQTNPHIRGPIHCLRQTVQTSGFSSLFRGMSSPLFSMTLINASVFAVYGESVRVLTKGHMREPTSYDRLLSGFAAGATTTLILTPADYVKCRLQMAGSVYEGPMQCLFKAIKERGIRGPFQGFAPAILREVPSYGIYFASFDYMKHKLTKEYHFRDLVASAVAGGAAGALSWTCVYPVDVIKTVVTTMDPTLTTAQERSMRNVVVRLLRENGWRYFFRGLGATVLRAVPVSAACFPIYEYTAHYLSTALQRPDFAL